MDIGKRIAAARTAACVTQQELADKLFVSRDLVSKWEQGRRRPDHGMIERIAEVLNVKPDSIISKSECMFHELKTCLPKGADIPIETLSALISRFLRERPQKEADIFIRRYYLMNTPAEIAIRYGMGANQVRSRLSKTAKKLGEFLEAECEGNLVKEEC
jgi:transcriptional regulator with XRE-family HTH domain